MSDDYYGLSESIIYYHWMNNPADPEQEPQWSITDSNSDTRLRLKWQPGIILRMNK